MKRQRFLPCLFLPCFLLLSTVTAFAAGPPCQPCAGVRVESPATVLDALAAEPQVSGEERLYVSWDAVLDGSGDASAMNAVLEKGGTPWTAVHFRTAPPLLENITALEAEIKDLARLARGAGERAHFQIVWDSGPQTPEELGFLIKRAAVAVTGASPDARVLFGPIAADPSFVERLYNEDIAAYVDGVVLAPGPRDAIMKTVERLRELDPGKGVVLDALPWPESSESVLPQAADWNSAGIAVTFFRAKSVTAESLAPMKILAREFSGDVSPDSSSVPTGAKAWTYVRGEDLSLRVIAETTAGETTDLFFNDPQLKSPRTINLANGDESIVFGQSRTSDGLKLPVEATGAASLVSLARMSAAELAGLEGLDEKVVVEDTRQMPVEEILRRLQAFEDDQARKLRHYEARSTLHLRFLVGSGAGAVETAYEGPFFFRQGEGFDWQWDTFYVDGVKWRGNKIPEIPLIQPEKAAAMPLEILLDKQYLYRLRGTADVDGRDCWVVDFEPVEVVPGRNLKQGTVWVDREVYARVKTRAMQLGLEGEVISNEETVFFTPLDTAGQPAAWSRDSFILPTRVVGQQLISLLNAAVPVEVESELVNIEINSDSFDDRLAVARASEKVMVRDTDKGLRYLVKDEEGNRVVQEELDTNRLFVAGGVFYDESVDFPIPLAGVNYLDLDWKDKGSQVNFFFAGPLLTVNVAKPRIFDSRWDAGVNLFGFFIKTGDELFRDGEEVPEEEVESNSASASFFVGRPLGNFTKLDFTYNVRSTSFGAADDTAENFVLPSDTLTHTFRTELSYNRSGWRFKLDGSYHSRSDWEPWGIPDLESGFSDLQLQAFEDQKDYVRWQATFAKNFWLKRFMKFGIELEHLDGENLDRFSSYDFGIFGDSSVGGYPSGLVRAEKADGIHLSYGLNIAELFRVEIEGDAVWATNEQTGLDNELLAGIGFEGSLTLPWQTLVNFEIGQALAGPGDSIAARIVFLKLFPQDKFKRWGKKGKKKNSDD